MLKIEFFLPGVPPKTLFEALQFSFPKQSELGFINSKAHPPSSLSESLYQLSVKLTLFIMLSEEFFNVIFVPPFIIEIEEKPILEILLGKESIIASFTKITKLSGSIIDVGNCF